MDGSDATQNPGRKKLRYRRWTQLETSTFLEALSKIQPDEWESWESVLDLHGENGTINNVLRNRNTSQLRDKVKHLKAKFLKEGIEVPKALAHVRLQAKDLVSEAMGGCNTSLGFVSRRNDVSRIQAQDAGFTEDDSNVEGESTDTIDRKPQATQRPLVTDNAARGSIAADHTIKHDDDEAENESDNQCSGEQANDSEEEIPIISTEPEIEFVSSRSTQNRSPTANEAARRAPSKSTNRSASKRRMEEVNGEDDLDLQISQAKLKAAKLTIERMKAEEKEANLEIELLEARKFRRG